MLHPLQVPRRLALLLPRRGRTMTACRLALTLWAALFLAGLLAWLTRGPEWLLASLDDEEREEA